MELWSTRHGSSSEAMLRKAGGEYCILSVTLGNSEQNISLDRKEMKDLFNALGNEIGYWDPPAESTSERTTINVDRAAFIDGPPDVMEWIREQVRQQYGKDAVIRAVDIETHFDFSKEEKLTVGLDIHVPAKPRPKPPVIVPSPMKVEKELTPEEWRESYAHYLAQGEDLTVTEIYFNADMIDPENLEWALAETKRVFGNRVTVEVFRSNDGTPPTPPSTKGL